MNLRKIKVEDCEFHTHVLTILTREGCNTLHDVAKRNFTSWLKVKGVGQRRAREIVGVVEDARWRRR